VKQHGHEGEQHQPKPKTRARDYAEKAKKAARQRYEKYKHASVDRGARAWRWWLRRPTEQKLTLTFEFVIAAATMVYAVIASFQWCTMRGQLTVMQRTLEVPNAAQLVLGKVERLMLTTGQEGFFTADIDNVGRLPAEVLSKVVDRAVGVRSSRGPLRAASEPPSSRGLSS
jgi:hypothetical protein